MNIERKYVERIMNIAIILWIILWFVIDIGYIIVFVDDNVPIYVKMVMLITISILYGFSFLLSSMYKHVKE